MKRSLLFALVLGAITGCATNSQPTHEPAPAWKPSPYYEQRQTHFETLPTQKGAIIFLGDSISDGAEWKELLPKQNVLNRGISGDTSKGVLMRIDEVLRHNPKKVFLLVGTNDITRGVTGDEVIKNIQEIATIFQQRSPKTTLYVQGILPVNDTYQNFPKHVKNSALIHSMNAQLKQAAPTFKYTYLDLPAIFVDEQGKMSVKYSNDGLHLLGESYTKWVEFIKPYLVK